MANRFLRVLLLGAVAAGICSRESSAQFKLNKNGVPVVPRGVPRSKLINQAFRSMVQVRNAQFKAAQEQWNRQQEANRLAAEKKLKQRQAAADAARKFKEEQRERIKARMAKEKEKKAEA